MSKVDLEWLPGDIPRSRHFDDIYFDSRDGVAESEFNFIDGIGAPQCWQPRSSYHIGETGFGTGLNFLLTWARWASARPAGGQLHFVSVERYPLDPAQLARSHRTLPTSLHPFAADLSRLYPATRIGYRRVHLRHNVVLTLLFGDVVEMLMQLEGTFDAWYLDGFAPRKNPAMWSPAVFTELARLSRSGAHLATFTAAGEVRRGLDQVGFEARRAPGFGRKRERIVARYRGRPTSRLPGWATFQAPELTRPLSILGDGIAGQSLHQALRRRGVDHAVTAPRSASADHLPRALVMPRLAADRSLHARLFSAAFAYAVAHYQALGCYQRAGVLDRSRRDRAAAISARWPEAELTRADALFYRDGGWVDVGAALVAPSQPEAEALVIDARGPGLIELAGLPLSLWRGQVTLLASDAPASAHVIVDGGFLLGPDAQGRWQAGASFERVGEETGMTIQPEDRDDDRNRTRAQRLFAPLADARIVGRWAGVRAALPDRMPATGPLPDAGHFAHTFARARTANAMDLSTSLPRWLLGGLGARGFTTAPLAAELLVCQLRGEPWPIERELALSIHPARFLCRALKRGRTLDQI